MKIFLSSTLYDLRDLRNIVETELIEDGHHVLASESGTIPIEAGKHSYDLCLKAAEQCDCLVAIIDGRFGGLMPNGVQSITEAEITAALIHNRCVLVFVRQAVWDAKEVYKKYMASGTKFHQTKIVTDPRVFELIDRLRGKDTDNWLFQFNLPKDLLAQVRNQLKSARPQKTALASAIKARRRIRQRLPEFRIRYASPDEIDAVHKFAVKHIGGGIAPVNKLRSWLQVNPRVFKVLEGLRKAQHQSTTTIKGYYSIRPITAAATKLLETGKINGAELLPSHIVPQNRRPAAIYIGGVAALGMIARGFLLALVGEEVDYYRARGVKIIYTRPLTKRGEVLATQKGFHPLPSTAKNKKGVYKLMFPG